MKKLLVIVVSVIVALAVFAGLVTLMLALNDWGRSAPSDAGQLVWALNIVVWPFLTYLGASSLLNKLIGTR